MASRPGAVQRTAPLVSCAARAMARFSKKISEGIVATGNGEVSGTSLPACPYEKAPDSAVRLEERIQQQRDRSQGTAGRKAQTSNRHGAGGYPWHAQTRSSRAAPVMKFRNSIHLESWPHETRLSVEPGAARFGTRQAHTDHGHY